MRAITARLLRLFLILVTLAALLAQPITAYSQPVLADAPDLGVNDYVTALAVQPDGKILMSGAFTQIQGREHPHIARINPDGSVDESFQASADWYSRGFQFLPKGKILIYGDFEQLNGQPQRFIGRLNADGTLDTTFAPNVNRWIMSAAVQRDGKIVIAGKFFTVNGQIRIHIARLNPDGTLDPDFHPDADDTYSSYISRLLLLPDGKILVSGSMMQIDGQPVKPVFRMNPDGSLDSTFQAGIDVDAFAFSLQPDGKILAGGTGSLPGSSYPGFLVRLNADGSLDSTFSSFSGKWVTSLALEPDGGIIGATMGGGGMFRLDHEGNGNPAFTHPPILNDSVYPMLLIKDKILIGGLFTQVNGAPPSYLALLNLDGSLAESFNLEPYKIYLPALALTK